MTVLEKIENDTYVSYFKNMDNLFEIFQKDMFDEVKKELQNESNIDNKVMSVYLRSLFLSVVTSAYSVSSQYRKDDMKKFLLDIHDFFKNTIESIKIVELLIVENAINKSCAMSVSNTEQKYYS